MEKQVECMMLYSAIRLCPSRFVFIKMDFGNILTMITKGTRIPWDHSTLLKDQLNVYNMLRNEYETVIFSSISQRRGSINKSLQL